jgi:hypothetical protein
MIKTALNVDREIVRLAALVLGTRGTTATIDAALRDVVDRAARQRLLDRVTTMSDDDRMAATSAWE